MASRRELLADILGLAARLSPRIALSLALLCWLPLHVIAVETAEIPASDGSYPAVHADAPAQFAHLVAAALQYLMPGALLAGTVVASLRRRRRKAHGRERSRTVPVGAMLAEDFYGRLDAAFRSRGYEVLAFEDAAPGTADLLVARGAERHLVQRSHWQSWQVGEAVIRELAAEISALEAHGGFVVTGGWFSREARELAVECGIELVDGDALGVWFGVGAEAKSARNRAAVPVAAAVAGAMPALRESVPVLRETVPVLLDMVPVMHDRVPVLHDRVPVPAPARAMRAAPRVAPGLAAPACPKCGTSMHKRQATRGKMQGQFYWACARQPQCLGILPCRAEPDEAHYGAALTH